MVVELSKHVFVLFFIILVVAWAVMSTMLAGVSYRQNKVREFEKYNASNWNGTGNLSTLADFEPLNAGEMLQALVGFHSNIGILVIDMILFVLGLFVVWILASTFFGVGG